MKAVKWLEEEKQSKADFSTEHKLSSQGHLSYVPVDVPLLHVVVAPGLHHIAHAQVDTDQPVWSYPQHLVLPTALKSVEQNVLVIQLQLSFCLLSQELKIFSRCTESAEIFTMRSFVIYTSWYKSRSSLISPWCEKIFQINKTGRWYT